MGCMAARVEVYGFGDKKTPSTFREALAQSLELI